MSDNFDFNAIQVAQRGFQKWAEQPHNKRWFRKIDGTPIPNDVTVTIAMEFVNELSAQKRSDGIRENGDTADWCSIIETLMRCIEYQRKWMKPPRKTSFWEGPYGRENYEYDLRDYKYLIEDVDAACQRASVAIAAKPRDPV